MPSARPKPIGRAREWGPLRRGRTVPALLLTVSSAKPIQGRGSNAGFRYLGRARVALLIRSVDQPPF